MKGGGGWMGTTEAAERLGIVPRTLYRLLDEGEIPAYKLGRVIRIKVEDLDAFLERHRGATGDAWASVPVTWTARRDITRTCGSAIRSETRRTFLV